MPENDELTAKIIGAAIEVHRNLGPGLLESAYEECLCHELHITGVPFLRQVALPINYKGIRLDCGYRLDLVIAEELIVEIKSVDKLLPIHSAQLITYLRLMTISRGLLINFNEVLLREGVRRHFREQQRLVDGQT